VTSTLTFNYRARNAEGRLVKGRVEAASQAAAISKVTALGVSPIEVKPQSTTGLQMEIEIPGLSKGVGGKELAVMSRQMATMIQAGLPLVTTLAILADQTESKKLAAALTQVRTDIEQGRGFSDSLAKHDRIFPPLMINLLRAGEVGGFLDRSLEAIAVNFEKDVKLRGAIKSALTYPVIVLCIAILGVAAMLLFIVPVFKNMFAQMGTDLPLPTQILVAISNAMPIAAPILVVAIIAAVIWWRRNKNKTSVRRLVDPIRLKLPVFGPLIGKIAIARFARNFAAMIGAGVPILRALQIVGETSGNWVIEHAMERVADSVRTGGSIAAPLMQEKVFPGMVTQMVAVGENSGSLEQMLDKIADFYDEEVAAATEQLTAMIEPIMIAFLGLVIGGMVISLYMPMFSLIGDVNNQN